MYCSWFIILSDFCSNNKSWSCPQTVGGIPFFLSFTCSQYSLESSRKLGSCNQKGTSTSSTTTPLRRLWWCCNASIAAQLNIGSSNSRQIALYYYISSWKQQTNFESDDLTLKASQGGHGLCGKSDTFYLNRLMLTWLLFVSVWGERRPPPGRSQWYYETLGRKWHASKTLHDRCTVGPLQRRNWNRLSYVTCNCYYTKWHRIQKVDCPGYQVLSN